MSLDYAGVSISITTVKEPFSIENTARAHKHCVADTDAANAFVEAAEAFTKTESFKRLTSDMNGTMALIVNFSVDTKMPS